ncbi:DUF3365 domain-containing protein [Mariniblastus sp.]|nr:DUF3365 domain-containing protein [Mariniblastus sp.]
MKTAIVVTLAIVLVFFGVSLAQQTTPQQPKEQKPSEQQPAESTAEQEAGQSEKDKAVTRTRREVKMLDDIYKGGIVLITKNYVNGDEDLPAGTAFKKMFEAAKKNGWHEVRLVDATGDPYDDANVAVSDFEKRAIKELRAGKPFVEETITEKDKRYFLAATPIPVVMEKCTMCHSNYDMDKKGLVIGALTYRVPINE